MNGALRVPFFRLCAPSAVLVAALLAACADPGAEANAAPRATSVVMAKVAPVEWRDSIDALGTARANESVTLTAKAATNTQVAEADPGKPTKKVNKTPPKPKNAELKIGVAPGNPPATVTVDGKQEGRTPVFVKVTAGSDRLLFKAKAGGMPRAVDKAA